MNFNLLEISIHQDLTGIISIIVIFVVIKSALTFMIPFNIADIRNHNLSNLKETRKTNEHLEKIIIQNEQLIKLNLENIELQKIISNKFKDKD